MIISIINNTNGLLTDEQVQTAIRAINRQIAEDFEPYWSMGARLRLEGKTGSELNAQEASDMRGDAVIYLWDQVDVANALGYHASNNHGIPYGFVFTELSRQIGEEWSVTLSHEALELIGDAQVNLLVAGPHPANPKKTVFHWYEMCDAVQDESYTIDGVAVANFILPLYFTDADEKGGRNDFLSRPHQGQTLKSFGVNPGGYVGFFNPETGQHETFTHLRDKRAEERMEIKKQAQTTRRAIRYQQAAAKGNRCDLCFDKVLPPDLLMEAARLALEENPENAHSSEIRLPVGVHASAPRLMAILTGKKWKRGRTLRVFFMDGDSALQDKVKNQALVWTQHANIKLEFVDDPKAEIRISFNREIGFWSLIGTDALAVSRDKQTMNFGGLQADNEQQISRVVLHEFGHALGCIHEHQHPENGIPWNRDAVISYYMGPPNKWSKDEIETNIFKQYSKSATNFSEFDLKSIMLYPIPKEHTLGGFEVGWNTELSETDKKFIGQIYP